MILSYKALACYFKICVILNNSTLTFTKSIKSLSKVISCLHKVSRR